MISKMIIYFVKGYQRRISPLFPPSCRYYPTCSNYMIKAIEKHGLKGILMGISRVLRCHPFASGGVDEVPNHFTFRRQKKEEP